VASVSVIHVVGSMMIDRVARVRAIPRPGETVAAISTATFAGGKGANQAAAAARCGARVRMLGRTGSDGAFIRNALREAGVDVRAVRTDDPRSGAATVMVAESGENAIVIAPESNRRIAPGDIERFLAKAREGEIALFQNECSALEEGIALAGVRGMRVWLNAAPADGRLAALRYEKLAGLIVNETEAEALTGEGEPRRALEALAARMPGGTVVVTLGAQGAIAWSEGRGHAHRGFVVDAVDTVGCGDAFVGAFLAAIAAGQGVGRALERGNAAGALAAMREGAIPSLPDRAEIDAAVALGEGARLPPRRGGGDACLACGHSLAAAAIGGRCPECGAEVVESPFPPKWRGFRTRARLRAGAWMLAFASACWMGVALLVSVDLAFGIRPMVSVGVMQGAVIGLVINYVLASAVGGALVAWNWPSLRGKIALGTAIGAKMLVIAGLLLISLVPALRGMMRVGEEILAIPLVAEFAGILIVLFAPPVVRLASGLRVAAIALACGLPAVAIMIQWPKPAFGSGAESIVATLLLAGGAAGVIAHAGVAVRLFRAQRRGLAR
jgi:ribokinase